jgi:hypothetical protein
MVELFQL